MVKIIDNLIPFTIDVLRMELEQKLPYWLSPKGKEIDESVLQEEAIMVPLQFGGEMKVLKNPTSSALMRYADTVNSVRVMRTGGNWYFWNAGAAAHDTILKGLGEEEAPGYLGYELRPGIDYDTKEKVLRPYHDSCPTAKLQAMVDTSRIDPLFQSITRKAKVTNTVMREKEIEAGLKPVNVAPYERSGLHGHHVDGYKRSLPEDAMSVNHTGPAIATFDPLLTKRMARRKKFRIRHGKPLKEAYNPDQPRKPKGSKHGGRWTSNQGGDCYPSAYRFMSKLGGGTLVHAMVSGQGSLTGKRYDHAWVEINDTVIDQSNGRSIVMPKDKYYALGEVNPNDPGEYRKYTYNEMLKKSLDSGTFGPWDLTESFDKY